MIVGTLFMVYTLHKRGSARTVSAEFELRTCMDFHRKELQRQRDLLRDVWSWYLLPFVPGMLVFRAGLLEQALERPNAPHKRALWLLLSCCDVRRSVCGHREVEPTGGG